MAKKVPLWRSAINRDMLITIEMIAEKRRLSFGDAFQLLMYESNTFCKKIDEIRYKGKK